MRISFVIKHTKHLVLPLNAIEENEDEEEIKSFRNEPLIMELWFK